MPEFQKTGARLHLEGCSKLRPGEDSGVDGFQVASRHLQHCHGPTCPHSSRARGQHPRWQLSLLGMHSCGLWWPDTDQWGRACGSSNQQGALLHSSAGPRSPGSPI